MLHLHITVRSDCNNPTRSITNINEGLTKSPICLIQQIVVSHSPPVGSIIITLFFCNLLPVSNSSNIKMRVCVLFFVSLILRILFSVKLLFSKASGSSDPNTFYEGFKLKLSNSFFIKGLKSCLTFRKCCLFTRGGKYLLFQVCVFVCAQACDRVRKTIYRV